MGQTLHFGQKNDELIRNLVKKNKGPKLHFAIINLYMPS